MPCLWNTPVGELIQKQEANEYLEQKAQGEVYGWQVILHVRGLL